DEFIRRNLRLAADVAAASGQVRIVMKGKFGLIPAEDATALALILTELVTNAVEHGLANRASGEVEVEAERDGDLLVVTVADDGAGLTDGEGPGKGLGTQIVQALVQTELRGTITWSPREGGGTSVRIEATLRTPRPAS